MAPLKHDNPKQPVTSEEFDSAMIAIKNSFDKMATKDEMYGLKDEVKEIKDELSEVKDELSEVKTVQEKTLHVQESILSIVQSIDQKLAPLEDLPARVTQLEEDVFALKYRRKATS